MRSNSTGFAEEADLAATPTTAYPNADPEYWLDAYPVLTEALANTEPEAEYGAQEVALDLAVIVSVRADNDEPFTDGLAVSIFLDRIVD